MMRNERMTKYSLRKRFTINQCDYRQIFRMCSPWVSTFITAVRVPSVILFEMIARISLNSFDYNSVNPLTSTTAKDRWNILHLLALASFICFLRCRYTRPLAEVNRRSYLEVLWKGLRTPQICLMLNHINLEE